MTVFTILMPTPQPDLVAAIEAEFPDDYFEMPETQWLIASSMTVVDLCARLGIADKRNPERRTGAAVVSAMSSYYGRAPTTVWDWTRSKLEAPVHG